MTDERKASTAAQEQNNATQAATSGQEQGRTFTQEEVNSIIRDRLAREREKADPHAEEREKEIAAREKDVSDRENLLACKEYIAKHQYPKALLGLYNTENAEEFKASVDKLVKEFPQILSSYTGVTVETRGPDSQLINTGGPHGHGLGDTPDLAKAFARKG